MTTLTQLENRVKILERIVLGKHRKMPVIDPVIKKSLNAISRVTNQSVKDIRGKSRKRVLVDARSIVMNHLKQNTRYSLNDIGAIFTDLHHATVKHALNNHNDFLITGNKAYLTKVEKFNELMKDA